MRTALSSLLLAGGLFGATLVPAPAAAQTTGELVSRTELRICADPSNLPFSDEKQQGFENKIAELIGRDLKLPVSYVWFPQVVGFVRNTLNAHRCDLITGMVVGNGLVQTTTPYYYTSYVMIYRAVGGLELTGIDDPKLAKLTIGVVAGTPPANLLVRHHLLDRMRSYQLMVDTRVESPNHQMIKDVADGKIDVGLLWGPFAGYYVHRDKLDLKIVPLKDEPGMPRMDYHIAMGVRANEPDWRGEINAVLTKERDAIQAVLKSYGIPLLNEQGQLIQ